MITKGALIKSIAIVLLCAMVVPLTRAQIVNIPRTLEDRSDNFQRDQNAVEFFYFPYRGPDIRIAEVVQNFKNLSMPDTISITPPDLSGYQNVYVFIGAISEDPTRPEDIAIMLVGNYLTRRLTFFTDVDFDRDFTDEFFTTTMRTGDAPRLVQLRPWGNSDKVFDLWLSVDRVQQKALLKRDRIVEKVRNQFSISPQLGLTSGSLEYRYKNEDIGFPTWYSVNSTGKSIGLNIDYTLEFMRFSLGAAYQNLYYWTSYLKVRTGEPQIITDPKTGQMTLINNVKTFENRDAHPRNRLEFSAKVAFLLPLGRLFDIQPFFKAGMVTYSPDRYEPNPSLERPAHKEGDDYFIEAGLQLDVSAGMEQSAYVGVSIQRLWWQPEGFFETVNYSDLEIEYLSLRFFAGYRFGL